mmetsp:Transcript_36076/g.26801  ORF Transcript_36076/g.26801 Transcript_36076/m.26801 type:complete len:84 (-) Transcript_36076:535-786(-)
MRKLTFQGGNGSGVGKEPRINALKTISKKTINLGDPWPQTHQNSFENSKCQVSRPHSNTRNESLERILGDRADQFFNQMEKIS